MAHQESSQVGNRRAFLRVMAGAATGVAAGGIPAIVAAPKAPSFPKGTRLTLTERPRNGGAWPFDGWLRNAITEGLAPTLSFRISRATVVRAASVSAASSRSRSAPWDASA